MSAERHLVRCAAYLILRKGDDVFLTRRAGTKYYNGWYSFPAGHVETDELPIETLIREVKEEIDVTVEEKDVTLVHTLFRLLHPHDRDYADFFFEARTWEGELRIMEPEKCDDMRWAPIGDLPENTIPYLKDILQGIDRGVRYSEFREEKHL